ncbi:MAG: histidinol-phosphatase [Clostridia bacterium]|nr:histidinol-phosphatase [Clostridia bacterium]
MRARMKELLEHMDKLGKQDFDLHMHTTFCDGKNTAEEMVCSAIEKGLYCVGISTHAPTAFDRSYAIRIERLPAYLAEMERLREKYSDKIRVLCGLEMDLYSELEKEYLEKVDYIIGSVHYIEKNGEYVCVDYSANVLRNACDRLWKGDPYEMVGDYYRCVASVCERLDPDIIGHIDLITKFIERDDLFDMRSSEYEKHAFSAIRKVVSYGVPFEMNYGAISRGYRTTPYPDTPLHDFILENGGRIIKSSDAHSASVILSFKD